MIASVKIGEHAYAVTGWTSRAPILKAYDCRSGPLRAAALGAPLFYRKYLGDWNPDANGADLARATIADLEGFRAYDEIGRPRLWIELLVGPLQGDWRNGNWSSIEALGIQVQTALPVCRAAGVGLAAFSWYTGQPEPEVWQYIASRGWFGIDPQIDVISVQEYTNSGYISDVVNVGRFRTIINAGWTGRIAILEGGMDVGGKKGDGWQNYMPTEPGQSRLQAFERYLQDYNWVIAPYSQVLGMTVFNAPGWGSFAFSDPDKLFSIGSTRPVLRSRPPVYLLAGGAHHG